MKKLLTIVSKGEGYSADVIDNGDGSFQFVGDMDIDVDGSPFWKNDPSGQADTSLHYKGKPIDSSIVPGIVLPPEIIRAVKGIVLGCKAEVTYKGRSRAAVVFDTGPHNKLGEASYCLATRLGIPARMNGNGGVDEQAVTYKFWPGIPALVDGITYGLQKSG